MPGFDGTGPRGMGSMTGGRRGYCAAGTGARFYSYGGFRRAGGYGSGLNYYGTMPVVPPLNREQELAMLKDQAQELQVQLEQIEKRVTQLESVD